MTYIIFYYLGELHICILYVYTIYDISYDVIKYYTTVQLLFTINNKYETVEKVASL